MSDRANETAWVMGDADINELRGSICTLETLTELMGKFDSNESLGGGAAERSSRTAGRGDSQRTKGDGQGIPEKRGIVGATWKDGDRWKP